MTAREHLLFYGRLKGLKKKVWHPGLLGSPCSSFLTSDRGGAMPQVLADAADQALKSVNLFNNGVGNKQASLKQPKGQCLRLGAFRDVELARMGVAADPTRCSLWNRLAASMSAGSDLQRRDEETAERCNLPDWGSPCCVSGVPLPTPRNPQI